MIQNKTVKHEPLIRISKRTGMNPASAWTIRIASAGIAFIVCALIAMNYTHTFSGFFVSLWKGTFDINIKNGTTTLLWVTLERTAILLCIALALAPAFKMKFWNIGAEGQTLIGCLVCGICMFYIRDKIANPLLLLLMLVLSIAAGIVWALLPALFKAKWNTNETLFTLMMNYIAKCLVVVFITYAVKTGSGVLGRMQFGNLPKVEIPGLSAPGQKYLIIVLVVAILTAIMFIYLKYSKHGYELTVVGESVNTAKYVGINVKKVIIRTMILSGAICGLAGWLLTTGYSHTVTDRMVGGDGFTAILVAWLAQFNPLFMVVTAFLVVFLKRGASLLSNTYQLNNDYFGEIIVGIFFFFIIGSEFFINYRIQIRGITNLKMKEIVPVQPIIEKEQEDAQAQEAEATVQNDSENAVAETANAKEN